MKKTALSILVSLVIISACSAPTSEPPGESSFPPATEVYVPTPTATEDPLPPVVGPEPSMRVAAFYYPWYFNEEVDGRTEHWGGGSPDDIESDYYPVLGPYSNSDPLVLAQHFAWLRQAGVGLIITSWWGQGSRTDRAVPLLLDMADHYGVKVAFHIEPYAGRSPVRLVQDINYIYANYGDHPAFFWTDETSCYSTGDQTKGLFFLWASILPDNNSVEVEAEYWQGALDTLHSRDPGALVITDAGSQWVTAGHFDGAYSYAVTDANEIGYSWATGMPACAWYIPGINPGFSAIKINYDESVNTPRRDGATYDDRWERMFATAVEPALVAITSFNEWHEGTQIEPAAPGMSRPNGDPYLDYSPLHPEAYLEMTREWAQVFLEYEWPSGTVVRMRVRTTSDWSGVRLQSGAIWRAPFFISVSDEPGRVEIGEGYLTLNQPVESATSGNEVEGILEIEFIPSASQEPVILRVDRGHIGSTWIEIFRYDGQDWVMVDSFRWAGVSSGPENAVSFEVDHDTLFGALP